MDYPPSLSYEECLKKIESKPFSSDFDIQLEAAEELYGTQVKFVFSIRDVEGIPKSMAELYSDDVCNRVKELLRFQIRKYAYLMK